MRRAAAGPALAIALACLAPALPAAADPPDATGWWWRAQTGFVAALPAPPTVPDGGLAVGGAPDGAAAVSALRFQLREGVGSPVLTLKVADDIGGAAAELAACPTGSPWTPALAGTWDDKPTAACSRGSVQGVRSEDGTSWSFALAPLLVGGVLDVVIVPAEGSVFQLAFEAPGQDALATTAGTAPDPAPSAGPAADVPVPRAAEVAAFTPALAPADQAVTAVAPGLAPPPTAPPTAAGSPRVAAPAGVGRAAPAEERRTARGVAIAVLVLAVAAGAAGLVQPGGAPAAVTTGGIGRFARQRAGSPPPIT